MKNESLRDILLRIESRLDRHDQRFDEQKAQIEDLTDLTVRSLNSLAGEVTAVKRTCESLEHRVLKLELTFEDFRSDSRSFWEQIRDNRDTLNHHERRLNRLEAG